MNIERVKNDRTWTCARAETIFITLFVVGEIGQRRGQKWDDRGIDEVTAFSS